MHTMACRAYTAVYGYTLMYGLYGIRRARLGGAVARSSTRVTRGHGCSYELELTSAERYFILAIRLGLGTHAHESNRMTNRIRSDLRSTGRDCRLRLPTRLAARARAAWRVRVSSVD
jgi:hypothetical protein